MPTYEYRCNKCGHVFEIFQAMTADPITMCPKCDGPVVRLTHIDTTPEGAVRIERAKALVRGYATARLVVTSRLHCALPCLALGTPVLFIETAADAYRFDGLRDLLHRATDADLLNEKTDFDPNAPPPNGSGWLTLRDRLISSCENFIRG